MIFEKTLFHFVELKRITKNFPINEASRKILFPNNSAGHIFLRLIFRFFFKRIVSSQKINEKSTILRTKQTLYLNR
jgi:hypothetical protein